MENSQLQLKICSLGFAMPSWHLLLDNSLDDLEFIYFVDMIITSCSLINGQLQLGHVICL